MVETGTQSAIGLQSTRVVDLEIGGGDIATESGGGGTDDFQRCQWRGADIALQIDITRTGENR